MPSDYEYILNILRSGSAEDLNELMMLEDSFPHGADSLTGTHWILHAIGAGSFEAIEWMLRQKVDLDIRDAGGDTVLHEAIERDKPDRYELLELILKAGADVNLKGQNDWTPAHRAAVNNDVKALKILVRNGANLSIKTSIDDYATPLEEARIMSRFRHCLDAIQYLQSLEGH